MTVDSGLRLNLGCGKATLPGWVNVDQFPGPGIDMTLDLGVRPWPWATDSVDEIRAHALLEHLLNWEQTLLEMARVLRRNTGTVSIIVPYKLVALDRPYHVRMFSPETFDLFCDNVRAKTAVPLRRSEYVTSDCERPPNPPFSLVSRHTTKKYPFNWHMMRWFGRKALYWPLGRRVTIEIALRRNEQVIQG